MKLQRREFIKLCGTGLVSLGGLSIIAGIKCAGIKRKDFQSDDFGTFLKDRLGEKKCTILSFASLAPSPHNTQPWYVKIIDQDQWIIGADQARSMKATDPDNNRLMLTLGLFAENLSLAAGAMGYNTKINIISDNFFSDDILRITLTESTPVFYPIERITLRKTIKNGFKDTIINKEHIERLSESLNGHFFYFPRGNEHTDCIRKGAVDAFKKWLDSEEAQAEHVRWLRIQNQDAREKRDGLTTEGMEIEGFTGWLTRSFFSNNDFAGSFMKNETIKFTEKTSAQGGGYVILTGYGRNVSGMIELGRRTERMLLLAREMGIGIQPMTQMLEMSSGREIIKANHSNSVDPQLILRIGYVDKYPEPVTLRRPLNEFVRF